MDHNDSNILGGTEMEVKISSFANAIHFSVCLTVLLIIYYTIDYNSVIALI